MYYSLLLRSRDRYGTGDFWCRLECETGSYQTFLPFRVVGGFGNIWNISWCLDFFTVFSANFIESCFLLAGSISSFRSLHPFSYSLPVIVATAFLWTLESERDCLLVIAPVHTGQFASRWTLPSLFQKSARVVLSTPSCFILLSLQMVFEAFFVMFSIWASHFRSFCNITPRIFKTGFTSRTSVPTWNSGGNACFLEKLKDIMKVFFWLRTKLLLEVSSTKRESSCCKRFSSGFIIICVLSQKLSGKLRFWVSGVSDFLRLIVAAFVTSSKMTVQGTMVRSEVCNSWCFCLES